LLGYIPTMKSSRLLSEIAHTRLFERFHARGGLILEKPAMPNTLVAAVENLLRAR
jgi:hypothetical protein